MNEYNPFNPIMLAFFYAFHISIEVFYIV